MSYMPPVCADWQLHVTSPGCNNDNNQNFTFSWDNFKDSSGLKTYISELHSDKKQLLDKTKIGKKNSITVSNLDATRERKYTFTVQAENEGGLISEAINSTIELDCRKPILTGTL